MRSATTLIFWATLLLGTTSPSLAQIDLSMLSFDVVETSATGNGSVLTLNYEIQNTGSAAAGAFTITFYYSDITSFSPGNPAVFPVVGSATVSAVAPGSTTGVRSTTVTLTPHVRNGTRYIHYFIDSDADVAETNEANNRSTQTTDPNADEDSFLVTGLPNLQVAITALSATSGTLGDVITVSYQFSNVGTTRAATNFWNHFFLSTDVVFDTGDIDLGRETENTINLPAGAVVPETFDVTIPEGLTAGSYFIFAFTDRGSSSGLVVESDETDNTDAAAFTLVAGPDLVMDSFSFTATPTGGTLGFGDTVDFSFTVRNQGGGNAGTFTIYFYYDDDVNLSQPYSTGELNQPVIGTFAVNGGLAAGATLATTATATLPGEALTGARFLHYYIDAGPNASNSQGDIFETDETNNGGASPITITGLPDLTVDEICAVPINQPPTACGPTPDVVRNGPFTTYTRLFNAGKARALNASARLYFSTDTVVDPGTDTYLNTGISGAIDAGAFFPSSTTYVIRNVTVPDTAPGGVGYAGVFADYNNTLTEHDETNNDGRDAINVLAPPDLVMDSFTIATGTTSTDGTPSAPGFGATLDLTFTIRNQGATDAGAFSVRFYYHDTDTSRRHVAHDVCVHRPLRRKLDGEHDGDDHASVQRPLRPPCQRQRPLYPLPDRFP